MEVARCGGESRQQSFNESKILVRLRFGELITGAAFVDELTIVGVGIGQIPILHFTQAQYVRDLSLYVLCTQFGFRREQVVGGDIYYSW